MTPPAAHVSSRALLAVGGAFLLAHAAGLALSPRADAPVCDLCVEYRVDPNIGSRDDLMLLPGIGPALADRIVEQRAATASQPAFRCLEDLGAVDRIGPALIERLRPHLIFPAPSDVQSSE